MDTIRVNGGRVELAQGDITLQEVDALVNAANSRLAGGGGVDGAVHRRGGPEIMAQTRREYPQGCPTGSAVLSGGGRLAAKYVLHAWDRSGRAETATRGNCSPARCNRCLELAVEHDCRSVAMPALSTGAYGYPMDQAARITLDTVVGFLKQYGKPSLVRVVLFDSLALEVFAAAMEKLDVRSCEEK